MGKECDTASTFVCGGCEENPSEDLDAVDEVFGEGTPDPSKRPLPTPVRRRLEFQTEAAPPSHPEARGLALSGPPHPEFSPRGSVEGSPLKRDKTEHAEEEPRMVCRRLDSFDPQKIQDDPQGPVSPSETFTFDPFSSEGATFSPTVPADSEDVNPRARAALVLRQLVALEMSHLHRVASSETEDAFLQRSALFMQGTLARQERDCLTAAADPPPMVAEEEAAVAARILAAEAELRELDERMTDMHHEEAKMARSLPSLEGHVAAESGLPEGIVVGDDLFAATPVERTSEEMLQNLSHSRLLIRHLGESLENSEVALMSSTVSARSRAWANFAVGRPKARHALARL